jgi:hypothetical protein
MGEKRGFRGGNRVVGCGSTDRPQATTIPPA